MRRTPSRSLRLLILALAAVLTLVAAGCGGDDDATSDGGSGSGTESTSEGPLKAAWIYVGPTNDGGWTQAHDAGRKAVEEALGDDVETTYKESVAEGPEASRSWRT